MPWCRRPPISEYSPSLFSRTITMSTCSGVTSLQRGGDARPEPDRPQVHVLAERAADRDQQAPEPDVVGHVGPADGAEEDRVGRAQGVERVGRHHPAGLDEVVAAPRVLGESSANPWARPAASSTSSAAGVTSSPIPSPGITAIRCVLMRPSPAPTAGWRCGRPSAAARSPRGPRRDSVKSKTSKFSCRRSWRGRLRDRAHAGLVEQPPQRDLAGALVVLRADPLQRLVVRDLARARAASRR